MTEIPDRRIRGGGTDNGPVADLLPEGYAELLDRVKNDVLATRLRAMRTANTELIALYWRIGTLILDRQREQGWGTRVIDRLAADLRRELGEQRGWSRSNLFSMRALAATWPDQAIVQQAVGRLPWGQVTVLLKLADPADRDWYADQAALGGWSRKVLEHHIATKLRSRAGAAANNFPAHLDPQDADQAREILRDPYVFDFLGLNRHASERELEDALIARLQDTLREFGCAFVGRQVRIEVQGDEFFIDCPDSRIIPIGACRALWRRGLASLVGITARDRWLASGEWRTPRSSRCDRCVALSQSVGDLTWEGRDDGASDVRVGGWGAGGIPQRRTDRCIAQVSKELLRDSGQVLRCARH